MANIPWEVKYTSNGIKFLVFHNNVMYDVSQIVYNITFTSILNEASKVQFSLLKDPQDKLRIEVGDTILFSYQDWNVFKGRILTMDWNEKGTCELCAYDQLFYLKKNRIYHSFKNPEFIEVVNYVKNQLGMTDNDIDLDSINKYTIFGNSKSFSDESYLDILLYYINYNNEREERIKSKYADTSDELYEQLVATKWLCLYDNFGKLSLMNIGDIPEKLLIIGKDSILTDYNYSIDISEDTYNKVMLYYTNAENKNVSNKNELGEILSQSREDGGNIKKWGFLSLFQNVNDKSDSAKLDDYAKRLFELKNVPKKKMTMTCLGYNKVIAGTGFILHLPDIMNDLVVYPTNVIHKWNGDLHTMEMQIQTTDNFPDMYGGNV